MIKRVLVAIVISLGSAAFAAGTFTPATVSAQAMVGAPTSKGKFYSEATGVKPLFIHITVADVLHNDPCYIGDQIIICPLMDIPARGL